MNDGSTSLRKLTITAHIDLDRLNAFLNVLGIAYRNERVITNRDVEVCIFNFILIYLIILWAGIQRS